MYPQDFMFIFYGFFCVLVYGSSISHTRRGLGAGVTQVVDFDCPEEFGYYPHPTDCTQYYVCVFGGALLESCTGGLMYSHELQTCDWPRNVGCVESNGSDGNTASTVRVTDTRSRNYQQNSALNGPQQSSTIQSTSSRNFQRQDYNRSRQHDVIQQQLYNEDIGPAEEGESDRQQRVYRGQPSSLGQVQRDRDGSRQIKTNIHTPNVIPVSTGPQDKISVVSFGNQRPSAPRPQEQYRIEQIQAQQLTSAPPSQSFISRPNEQYNTSQRFQPDQYDQYYAVYDDVDIYRQNDYNQQYQTPSSTPSSTIAHQYRGSVTHKQALEVERVREPVQQQRNEYVSDIYSPPPAIQDFNDQYNVQIDDQQQYQQLTQSTPKLSSRSEKTNSTRETLTESTTTIVAKAPDNATTKHESPSSSIIRRSDSNSYFSAPNFGPSTVLLPPLKHDETTRKFFDSEYTTTVKSEKQQLYSSLIPALREGGRTSFEPPKNGGALAKTFSSFDSLLTSFIEAITNPNGGSGPVQDTKIKPPPLQPPKSSPETIVRSEIGRIHHDPIIITENFTIRLPNYRKSEESKTLPQTTLVVPLPSLPSTSASPPPLAQNDYLAYFVEIEPKKPKVEEKNKRNGLYANVQSEKTTESNVLNLESGGFSSGTFETKPKPYSDFVRLVTNGKNSKSGLGLEPIVKTQESKEFEGVKRDNERVGGSGGGGRVYQPVGKWVIAKDNKYSSAVKQSSFEVYPEERPRGLVNFHGTVGLQGSSSEKDKAKDAETALSRESENSFQSQPTEEAEVPPTTIVSGPYKFLYVDADTTKESLSSLSAFSAGSKEKDRTRFQYKTNPESRVRGSFYDRPKEPVSTKEEEAQEPISQEALISYSDNLKPNYATEDSIRYIYKTNPESRIVNRYLSSGGAIEGDKYSEKPKFAPEITVTDARKLEEEEALSRVTPPPPPPPPEIVPFREKPIHVLPSSKTRDFELTLHKEDEVDEEDEDDDEEEDDADEVDDEIENPANVQFPVNSGKTSGFLYKTVGEGVTSSQKPYRLKTTTEVREISSETESETESEGDDVRKPYPRRIVKVQRNDLKGQRLLSNSKVKRLRKLVTKSPPIIVLEELEEKTLSKENEIHSSYRGPVVTETAFPAKNKTRFRFTVEDERDFATNPGSNRIGFPATTSTTTTTTTTTSTTLSTSAATSPTTEKINFLGKFGGKSGLIPFQDSENDLPERDAAPHPGKLYPQIPSRPLTLKNVTSFENRATTKAQRGKFKPSTGYKLRLKPTTASPDSESIPGPHLSTRGPGGYTIGSNEINRGTPVPNRGTRPTLKPSTAIVSKASEFIDIYRYPPRRPQNLYATPTPDKSAAKCRKDVCLLPDCNCGGKDIPGGYSPEEIPQLVLLTFDDSVNDLNKGLYADLFERGRVNPNGCPISATFYVSHEWTDYSQVQNLYAKGHEIASHSITHSFGEQFSQKKWTKEIAGQREILAAYGGVRLEDIRGMRAPFLAVGGNKMFKMLYDSNFTYDSSMPIYENRPPSWPYTLDYKLFHDCMIPPCPTKSYPGVWEVPMVMWQDLNGGRCSMGDACSNPPTADGVYKMLIKNFERHFTTNRAPFGLYYHAAWFTHEHHKEGFIAFLDTIVNMPEVWLVTTTQAIEWVRDPQPLSTVNSFPPFQCNVEKAKKCNNPKVCNLWHKSGVRYMRTCQPCPDVYPWTGKTGVRNSRVDNDISEE